MMKDNKNPQTRRAQAVIELAVFGAILIFIIAGIVQQGTGTGFTQNIQLQAMRKALLMSYKESHSSPNDPTCLTSDRMARNTASYMLIEDRLSPTVSKYGSIDRQPLVAVGSGTFTKNLFKPTDWSDYPADLPIMDVEVNGSHFAFTMSGAATYLVRRQGSIVQIWEKPKMASDVGLVAIDLCSPATSGFVLKTNDPEALARLTREWTTAGWEMDGAPPFYTVLARNNEHWARSDELSGEDLQRRYDLQRNGDYSDDPPEGTLKEIPWQWFWMSLGDVGDKIDSDNGTYPSVDVDGDKVEEIIYQIAGTSASCGAAGAWSGYEAAVMDPNAGDMYGDSDKDHYTNPDDVPGMRPDTNVFTWTCQAGNASQCTTFEVREGKLYKPATNELVSSTNWKRQYDVITRVFQMNKKMVGNGSLCADPAHPTAPVEVCCGGSNCCTAPNNLYKTCFSMDTKKLFVRSRLKDYRGHKWATKTLGD